MNRPTFPHSFVQAPSHDGITEGYMPGFGNDFETEALPGALPQGQNSPQKCSYGLYGEQLSGTAFTAPSHQNERTWCYRIRPSVKHSHRYEKIDLPYWKSAPHIDAHHDHRRRREYSGRHGQPHLFGNGVNGGRIFLFRGQ